MKPEETTLTLMAARRAQGDPLPGALAEALLPESKTIGQFTVRPVVPADWFVLKKINSPLWRMMVEEDKKSIAFELEDQVEIIFQFTRSPAECRKILTQGREHFLEQAMAVIGDKLSPKEMAEVSAAINDQLNAYYSSVTNYIQKDEREGVVNETVRNFPQQPT